MVRAAAERFAPALLLLRARRLLMRVCLVCEQEGFPLLPQPAQQLPYRHPALLLAACRARRRLAARHGPRASGCSPCAEGAVLQPQAAETVSRRLTQRLRLEDGKRSKQGKVSRTGKDRGDWRGGGGGKTHRHGASPWVPHLLLACHLHGR